VCSWRRCQLDWYAELETGPATAVLKIMTIAVTLLLLTVQFPAWSPLGYCWLAALWMQNRGAGKSYAMRRAGVEALYSPS